MGSAKVLTLWSRDTQWFLLVCKIGGGLTITSQSTNSLSDSIEEGKTISIPDVTELGESQSVALISRTHWYQMIAFISTFWARHRQHIAHPLTRNTLIQMFGVNITHKVPRLIKASILYLFTPFKWQRIWFHQSGYVITVVWHTFVCWLWSAH